MLIIFIPFVCSFASVEYHFSLLRKDGTEKPGWYAYQSVIAGMRGG